MGCIEFSCLCWLFSDVFGSRKKTHLPCKTTMRMIKSDREGQCTPDLTTTAFTLNEFNILFFAQFHWNLGTSKMTWTKYLCYGFIYLSTWLHVVHQKFYFRLRKVKTDSIFNLGLLPGKSLFWVEWNLHTFIFCLFPRQQESVGCLCFLSLNHIHLFVFWDLKECAYFLYWLSFSPISNSLFLSSFYLLFKLSLVLCKISQGRKEKIHTELLSTYFHEYRFWHFWMENYPTKVWKRRTLLLNGKWD